MAQLYSLSMRDLLAQAHHLSGLPSFKSNLPNKSSELSKSSGPKKPLEPSKPSGQTRLHFDTLAVARYKKAANRVHPMRTTLPEEYRILHCTPSNPLLSLPPLPRHPPDFVPSEKFTKEQMAKMNINPSGFLWLEEHKFILFLIKEQEAAIAWDPSECGNFRKDYFEPIVIPMVEHIPWVEQNIPIPPGIYDEVIKIIKEKIKIGVYERSNSSYWSKWFCVLKKDGKSLRIVHDLQPLNEVTIQDLGAPLFSSSMWIISAVEVPIWVLIFLWLLTIEAWLFNCR